MGPGKKFFEAWKSSENMFPKKSMNPVSLLAQYCIPTGNEISRSFMSQTRGRKSNREILRRT